MMPISPLCSYPSLSTFPSIWTFLFYLLPPSIPSSLLAYQTQVADMTTVSLCLFCKGRPNTETSSCAVWDFLRRDEREERREKREERRGEKRGEEMREGRERERGEGGEIREEKECRGIWTNEKQVPTFLSPCARLIATTGTSVGNKNGKYRQ